ncbi:MAG: hypothetical protein LAE24_01955 [Candidatus Contendobacter sp.]|nr:hypothetical protein [Candidatus Contendobacter sp.]
MFRGIHRLSLDSKGRLSIPARYRQPLQDEAALQASDGKDNANPCPIWIRWCSAL